jgi:RimJ/RimL family protein N-acetyltransferase
MTQTDVDEFVLSIKTKYKKIVQTLTIEYYTNDNNDNYIVLYFIRIAKSQQQKGYGSAIMGELTKFADYHNVRIKLSVTDVFGVSTKVLYAFYIRHGFTPVTESKYGQMIYYPNS